MMNKKVLITLSCLFFVCMSNAMEDEKEVPSLLSCAVKGVAQLFNQRVQEDVALLKKDGQLTAENVRKNIENEMELLWHVAPPVVMEKYHQDVMKAYRQMHTQAGHFWEEYIEVPEYDNLAGGSRISLNGYRDIFAVTRREEKSRDDGTHLDIWYETPDGWRMQGSAYLEDKGTVYGSCWGEDDELLLFQDNCITYVPQPDRDGLNQRSTIPFRSDSDCYYQWYSKFKILAIETRLHPDDSDDERADVALMQLKDGTLQPMQIIPCGKAISSIFMGFDRHKKERLYVWSDRGRNLSLWEHRGDEYRFEEEQSWPDRGPASRYDCRLGLGKLYVKHNSDVFSVRWPNGFAGYVVVHRDLKPLYQIAERIVSSENYKNKQDEEHENE